MMIINDDSRVINRLETSLTHNARVVIYDRHMFIVQRPGPALCVRKKVLVTFLLNNFFPYRKLD
jgi:hypothetical protein